MPSDNPQFKSNVAEWEDIGPLDAAILVHDPPYAISSPNMSSVPLYYFDPQPLRARADGRFGIEDCWQHPQAWAEKYSFAPAIMRKPSAKELESHEFRLLWWNPQHADYILLQGSAFADLGKLSSKAAEPLLVVQQRISDRLRRFGEQNSIPQPVHYYEASMRSTCTRLQDCPMTFRDIVGQVAEFQRLCLDLLAMLDWLEIFHPRSIDESLDHPRPADLKRIGCFTSDPEVTKRLFLAGLPVWLIRYDHALPPTTKIKHVAPYMPPSPHIIIEDWHDESGTLCPFPTLHHGHTGADRHKASRKLGSAFADTPNLADPLISMTSAVGKAPSPASTSSRSVPYPDPSQTHKKRNKKTGGTHNNSSNTPASSDRNRDNPGANRNKWEDVACDLVPPDIPVWTRALRQVDRNPKRIRPNLQKEEKGYAFPDPNSLAGLPPLKQAQKLCAWLSLRAATCARAFTQAGRKAPTGSGAVWRLATDINQVNMIPDDSCHPSLHGTKETKAAKLRDAVKHLFGDELLAKLRGDVEQVEWHEVALQVRDNAIVDLDPNITREIIWELFEHNFRYELLALDMVAAPSQWVDDITAVARKDCIRTVYGRNAKFVIWSDPFPRVNEGLCGKGINDRVLCLEFLRRVLKDWPEAPCAITDGSFYRNLPRTPEQNEALEVTIVNFYCQTFFDYFGRPPIVPHHIPLHADAVYQQSLRENVAA